MMLNNKKIKINHMMADTISISIGQGAYSGDNTSEIAFFKNRNWVVVPIPEFATYHDGSSSIADTAVYPHVPNEEIEKFLERYSA